MFFWLCLMTMIEWLKSNDHDEYMIKLSHGKSMYMNMSILWLWSSCDILMIFDLCLLHDYVYVYVYGCLWWMISMLYGIIWLIRLYYFRHPPELNHYSDEPVSQVGVWRGKKPNQYRKKKSNKKQKKWENQKEWYRRCKQKRHVFNDKVWPLSCTTKPNRARLTR